uniref:Uncharacterized protein n=1 Tax=uncultured delta proteobacterium HF0770_45N15 TaxID=710835 RepID=E0XZ03_9DELT|nr:hypothetical protein [uncultured delta proteobacterium HF0770_45N15]
MTPDVSETEATPGAEISRILIQIRKLLFLVSAGLALATSPFGLDLVVGSLLGSTVVVLNMMGSAWPIRQLLVHQRIHPMLVLFQLLKLGLSGVVLYLAILHLEVSTTGLVIGLSNIILTSLLYTVLNPGAPGNESTPTNT